MERIEVVVIPVALVPFGDDELRMMAFTPAGAYLRSDVHGPRQAVEVAEKLTKDAGAVISDLDLVRLEEVAFVASGPNLKLVYTAALPLADDVERPDQSSSEPPSVDWTLLTPWVGRGKVSSPAIIPPEQALVRNYWRRQLEETSAVLEFLPRYFTTNQVRAAYSSLWGEEQHVGAFHRWFHDREAPKTALVQAVPEDFVRASVEDAFVDVLKDSKLGPRFQPDTPSLTPAGAVGISAALVATTPLGIVTTARLAGALVGRAIAYQQKTGRGKKPLWYERSVDSRILIDDPYAPRPRWLPTGAAPMSFH